MLQLLSPFLKCTPWWLSSCLPHLVLGAGYSHTSFNPHLPEPPECHCFPPPASSTRQSGSGTHSSKGTSQPSFCLRAVEGLAWVQRQQGQQSPLSKTTNLLKPHRAASQGKEQQKCWGLSWGIWEKLMGTLITEPPKRR